MERTYKAHILLTIVLIINLILDIFVCINTINMKKDLTYKENLIKSKDKQIEKYKNELAIEKEKQEILQDEVTETIETYERLVNNITKEQ